MVDSPVHVLVDEEEHRNFCLACLPLVDWCRSCGDRDLYIHQVPDVTRQRASTSLFSVAIRVTDCEVSSSSSLALPSAFAVTLDPHASAVTALSVTLSRTNVTGYVSAGPGAAVAVLTRGFELTSNTVPSTAQGRGDVRVVVDKCQFKRLKAGSAAWGGAVAVQVASAATASVIVRDTRLDGCASAVGGGGVSLRFAGHASWPNFRMLLAAVSVVDSVFTSNAAGSGGGGLYVSASGVAAAIVNVTRCAFTSNVGDGGGGMELSTGTVINSDWPRLATFTDGNAFEDNGVKSSGGGGIKVTRSVIVSSHDQFRGNYGGPNGGHVFISARSEATFMHSRFDTGNAAFGGSLMVRDSNAVVSQCAFHSSQGCVRWRCLVARVCLAPHDAERAPRSQQVHRWSNQFGRARGGDCGSLHDYWVTGDCRSWDSC